jgi:hypothetical protein
MADLVCVVSYVNLYKVRVPCTDTWCMVRARGANHGVHSVLSSRMEFAAVYI